jgi:putative acetyltransferase
MKNTTIKIRPATRFDFDTIEAVHKAAFSVSDFGYNGEAQLARQLHEAGDALVSVLAEADGKTVGHVLFSRMIVEADGKPVVAAALAPTGVVPEWQGKGIGATLIKAGLAALKVQGVQLSFAVGNTDYYLRYGYTAELAKPYSSPYAGPYFLAVLLDPKLTAPTQGKAEFAPTFANF